MKKKPISDYLSIGSSVGICAALGVVVGALLQNLVFWLCIGAGAGVVVGAVLALYNQKTP
ncbi:MAG: hypothetical protein GX541_00070 [Clostridiales bacterium]|jgi:predicted cobalt transporter CbtA|nr:hypothetical protein [Clostridiales bacterium]